MEATEGEFIVLKESGSALARTLVCPCATHDSQRAAAEARDEEAPGLLPGYRGFLQQCSMRLPDVDVAIVSAVVQCDLEILGLNFFILQPEISQMRCPGAHSKTSLILNICASGLRLKLLYQGAQYAPVIRRGAHTTHRFLRARYRGATPLRSLPPVTQSVAVSMDRGTKYTGCHTLALSFKPIARHTHAGVELESLHVTLRVAGDERACSLGQGIAGGRALLQWHRP